MNKSAKEYLNNAINQLNINSKQSNKYACLELRQCIESLTYEKLRAYKDRIPDSILSKWQPAQAIKMLEELEPSSKNNKDIDITITILEKIKNFKFNQKEISSKFISNRYHKLSSYLHVPLKEKDNKSNLHTDLVKLVEELKPYVDNKIYSTIAKVNRFSCREKGCNQEFIRNADGIKVGDIITCFNPNCKAEYIIKEKKETGYMIKPNEVLVECNCGYKLYIPNHKLKNDKYSFRCKKCQSKYIITKAYKMEIDNE